MALIGTIETNVGPANYFIITARISYKFYGVRLVLSGFYDEARRGDKSLPPLSKPLQEWEFIYSDFPDADVPTYADAYAFINAIPEFLDLVSDELPEGE